MKIGTTGTTTWLSVEVDDKELVRRMKSLLQNIGPNTEIATREALEHIHQKAMENLYGSNLKWGSSTENEEESIRQTVDIKVEPVRDGFIGSLSYTSPHAKLQEYGGTYIYNRYPELGPMPIGKQEGHVEGFGYNILGIIQGKYFLTRAFMSEGDTVRSIYEKYINKAIRDSE
jgi:hypothetical protein